MRRAIALVGCGLAVLGGIGCQNFRYVQQDAHGGVIEVKASEREAAVAKLRQQEGDIEIVNEVPKGKPGGAFDPNAPVRPSERMSATASSGFGSIFASGDDDKVQIKYTKKAIGTAASGLPPAPKDDGIVQTGGFQSKSGYDRTPTAGMATVGGQKSSSSLPVPDMNGYLPGGK